MATSSRLAPGWNLKAPLAGPAAAFGPTPVRSSFADHPTRPNSGSFRFGSGPATRPANANITSAQGLAGVILSEMDMYGSSSTVLAAHKVWPGTVRELTDWRERKGYGTSPAYLRRNRQLAEVSRAGSVGSMSSVRRPGSVGSMASRSSLLAHTPASESTMRSSMHPLEWRQYRANRQRSLQSIATTKRSCCTYGLDASFHSSSIDINTDTSSSRVLGRSQSLPIVAATHARPWSPNTSPSHL